MKETIKSKYFNAIKLETSKALLLSGNKLTISQETNFDGEISITIGSDAIPQLIETLKKMQE